MLRRPNWRVPAFIAVLVLTFGMALLGSKQVALAGESNHTGLVESMPSNGLQGNWIVGGVRFVTNGSTEFRQEKGALAVGVCAEVEYVGSAQPYTATKIASKSSDDCNGSGTVTPSVTPDSTPSPGSEREVYGRVERMPAPGLVGDWVVNGVTYRTSSSTEFEQRSGPFVVGACVKIHYNANSNPFPVREMRTESTADCTNSNATPVSTPSATSTSTPSGEREIYGLVESMPGNRVGNWVINGVTYVATESTEFQQEHGAFAVGACVKIHAQNNTMREIETEQAYRCGGSGGSGGGSDDGSGEAELYGILQSFPANLIGNWNVGGITFAADSATEFKQREGVFAVGSTVKVHFGTDGNGIHRAREIETRFANDDNGRDDDGNGSFEGAEGHAYGAIDAIPGNQIGLWRIGGIEYSVSNSTVLSENDGTFAVGKQVKVEYYLDGNGGRIARKIETTSETGGVTAPTRFKLFGFVSQMPANGFVGTWVVDNIIFSADGNSQFKENNGLFGLGAYVAVEYTVQNGTNQVHEIETHVPPGAGPNLAAGRIDDKGGQLVAAAQLLATWTIAGTSYTVTPATDLNDFTGALNVGDTAVVNSYLDGNGNRVATQIRGITLDEIRYVPIVQNQ
ncbi:MAG: hypothetical protein KDE53_40020 [Caldilineaceae bacterium]|nr:hypothetical protein [Caldilineaceae bacterium]